jgi:TRAP transporter 4TM/12TM fusion protein
LETYFSYLAFGSDALLGSALEIITTTVLLFVLFAKCFELCGGADFVSRLAFSASARSRGGPIKAAVIASGLFGSISGSTTSNVLSSGSFTIPMMRRMGVPPATAGGIEAVASTGGQIMPPVMGTAAFLMSDIAGLSYLSVITAALLPALLYYLSLMLEADRVGLSLSSPESDTREPLPVILRGALGPLLPVAAIVITLFRFDYAPHWAALSGIAAALLVALWRERSPAKLCKALFAKTVEMAPNAVQLVIVGAAIGVMLAAINKTGVAVQASIAISDLSESGLLAALLAVGLAAYVLGLGLSTTAVYVLVGTLLAPSLVALGVPVIAAHLFVFYMAMLSMISPPIAFACLVAASLSGATFLATCRAALRFSWLLIPLPFAFVYSPELLLEGRLWQSLASFAAACIGVLACANALSGRDGRRLDA